MKILKDKKMIVLIGILVVFTIGYFMAVNKISHAFGEPYDPNDLYEVTMDTIRKSAIAYGENHTDLFQNDNIVYIKVQDLIDSSLLVPNEEGKIINPLDTKETLNLNVVKIKYEDSMFDAEVDK